jgi:crossover junction endodeoxyribonuclease RuvC
MSTQPTLYAAIDPGLSGAIGFLHEDGSFADVYDMPIVQDAGKKRVDAHEVAAILKRHSPRLVMLEKVSSRPGEGVAGAFSFGSSYGILVGVLAALGLPYDLVTPQAWKKRMGIAAGSDKQVSIALAKRLIPTATDKLTRKKDDGRAEALLLAKYAMQQERAA